MVMHQSNKLKTSTKERLLGYLRNGDFVHPGGADAIEMVFSMLGKDEHRTILDVGCGIGGTAAYMQDHHYGKVVGIDKSKDVVAYASKTYSHVQFLQCDVFDVENKLAAEKFDVICMINSFNYFPNQLNALIKLNKLSHQDTQLVIFEYTDLTNGEVPVKLHGDDDGKNFSPIKKTTIPNLLLKSGWNVFKYISIDENYEQWYTELCDKIQKNKSTIMDKFSKEAYKWAENMYSHLLKSIQKKEIGGCLLFAKCILQS